MHGITPNLWFNNNAEEAANFYVSAFKNSRMLNVANYGEAGAQASGMPKGSVMTVDFELAGSRFVALNGGPIFTFTPAISFFVTCQSEEEINLLWKTLSEGGKVLMEFDKYPFSDKYGWVQDKYGLSWQLNLTGTPQAINPFLMFVGEQYKKAEDAAQFYISVFSRLGGDDAEARENSRIITVQHYGPGTGEPEDAVVHANFTLGGDRIMAMDSGEKHEFNFTHAVSFLVNCETQEEIDYLWDKLSEGGQTEVCGWLADKYGVAWQIVPVGLDELMAQDDPVKLERVSAALFQMTKIDISELERAERAA